MAELKNALNIPFPKVAMEKKTIFDVGSGFTTGLLGEVGANGWDGQEGPSKRGRVASAGRRAPLVLGTKPRVVGLHWPYLHLLWGAAVGARAFFEATITDMLKMIQVEHVETV